MSEGKIKVNGFAFTEKSTISRLYLNDTFMCFTLEDKDRGLLKSMDINELNAKKVFAETAIPAGTYEVIIDMSAHFKKLLPHILNVPGFEGVRIHSGNKSEDTEGCLLVGTSYGKDLIMDSRNAFDKLFAELQKYDKLTIEISREREVV